MKTFDGEGCKMREGRDGTLKYLFLGCCGLGRRDGFKVLFRVLPYLKIENYYSSLNA